MIKQAEFKLIENEVVSAIKQAFDTLFEKSRDWTYILFMAHANYDDELALNTINISPYVVSYMPDLYDDRSRYDFLLNFLNQFYAFKEQTETDNNEYRLHLELMLYTHIWESKPFIRQLLRFTNLILKDEYSWRVKLPNTKLHEIIREEIRDKLKSILPAFSSIITKGYINQLRNAFAHSDYSFDLISPRINLNNYNPNESWSIKFISFDEWSKCFCYSFLFNYHFMQEYTRRKNNVENDFNTNKFSVIQPFRQGRGFRIVDLYFDRKRNSFSFYDNQLTSE